MPTITGKEFIHALERVASLEWYKYHSVKEALQLNYPPIIVWRFDKTSMTEKQLSFVENLVYEVVGRFKAETKWVVSCHRERNWVLCPVLVQQLDDSGEFDTDVKVLIHLAAEKPEFGQQANLDLADLAQELFQAIENIS